jgi:lysophospholipase L1-like esterase
MLECLIMGDSIAVGTKMFKPECTLIGKSGINSYQWVNTHITKTPFATKTVIISLGSNDLAYVKTESELKTIRLNTKADKVYWILPAIKPNIQEIVKKIATENGDIVLPIRYISPDGVHPTGRGYKDLAERTK